MTVRRSLSKIDHFEIYLFENDSLRKMTHFKNVSLREMNYFENGSLRKIYHCERSLRKTSLFAECGTSN